MFVLMFELEQLEFCQNGKDKQPSKIQNFPDLYNG